MQTLEPHIQFYIFTARYIDLLIHHQNLTRKALNFISFFITAIHYLHSVPDNLTFSVFFSMLFGAYIHCSIYICYWEESTFEQTWYLLSKSVWPHLLLQILGSSVFLQIFNVIYLFSWIVLLFYTIFIIHSSFYR